MSRRDTSRQRNHKKFAQSGPGIHQTAPGSTPGKTEVLEVQKGNGTETQREETTGAPSVPREMQTRLSGEI